MNFKQINSLLVLQIYLSLFKFILPSLLMSVAIILTVLTCSSHHLEESEVEQL